MKYYYLVGIDKLGPYTLAEILNRNLPAETLILRDDKNGWHPLSEFKELNGLVEKSEILVKPSNTNYSTLILLILISVGLSVLITYLQQRNDFEKINDEVNLIFKGKSAISDYSTNTELDGKLYNVNVVNADANDPIFNTGYVKSEKRVLIYEPYKSADDRAYEKKLENYNMFKNLTQYYEAKNEVNSSGYDVLKLEKGSESYTLTNSFSGDMAYAVPGNMTSRLSINKCYETAAKFLITQSKDNSYEMGSYSKINNFKDLQSEFYEVNQRYPKKYYSNDTLFVDYGKDYFGKGTDGLTHQIDKQKITSLTSRNDASVIFPNLSVVWYKSYSNSYEIKSKDWVFLKYCSIYSIVGVILSIIIFYYFKNKRG